MSAGERTDMNCRLVLLSVLLGLSFTTSIALADDGPAGAPATGAAPAQPAAAPATSAVLPATPAAPVSPAAAPAAEPAPVKAEIPAVVAPAKVEAPAAPPAAKPEPRPEPKPAFQPPPPRRAPAPEPEAQPAAAEEKPVKEKKEKKKKEKEEPAAAAPGAAPTTVINQETLLELAKGKYAPAWHSMFKGEWSLPSWIQALDAHSAPTVDMTVDGKLYTVGSMCKASDCSNDRLVAAFNSEHRKCWGLEITVPHGLGPDAVKHPKKYASLQWYGNPDQVTKKVLMMYLEKDPSWK